MADKKSNLPYTITKADVLKLPRNEQRRLLELGYVEGEAPPSEEAAKEESKK